MFGSLVNVALTVLAVSLIILVHELGHFIAAKAVGLRVEVFSIGFWKKVLGFRIGETEYRLSLIPLGGYVKVTGDLPQDGEGEPHEFWSKTPGQRAIFVVGGVVMNFVLALVLFIIAFAIGVPFTVADVGQTMPGDPAWEAGLKRGDKIVAVDDIEDPVFVDLIRVVALSDRRQVELKVLRDGRNLTFRLQPYYSGMAGLKLIGIVPPLEPVVSGLAKVGGQEGVSPAQEAGIELGDRILAINGKNVETAYELTSELLDYPNDEVELLVEREGRRFTVRVRTQPVLRYVIGISGVSTTIESLEGEGMAQQVGLRVGDRIAAVNGAPVQSLIEIQEQIRRSLGEASLHVVRDGEELAFRVSIPDLKTLDEFDASMLFETSTTLTWVQEGAPAWQAGVRPGNRMVSVGGEEVEEWGDVIREGNRAGRKERKIQWARGSEVLTALVQPVEDTDFSPGHLGIILREEKTVLQQYGALGAVRKGLVNTYRTIQEVYLMVRGFVTQQISPRHVGGILTIAVVSYHAAQQGIGKLLYLTAVISAAIALLNILPIPVLDGGHLLFLAIEKVRGRRLGERALTVAQTVGFVLLMALVVYALRNDILRLLQMG